MKIDSKGMPAEELAPDDPRMRLMEHLYGEASKFCAEHLPDYEITLRANLTRKKSTTLGEVK